MRLALHLLFIIDDALPVIRRAIASCAFSESDALMRALDGRFIARVHLVRRQEGRPETLPTGRNFYSLDSRALPTPTAWKVGKASAEALISRHVMEEGEWPRALTLSAWGTPICEQAVMISRKCSL